eukprot:gb/GFBE01025565.1/.p1 GENE.gb/GFBE01025565.1/~~gb/GFBE01025565.1/.p1  ORF type:complete len:262 (+),score=29.95 gb/GFBE01025565.1/:1-786(+)
MGCAASVQAVPAVQFAQVVPVGAWPDSPRSSIEDLEPDRRRQQAREGWASKEKALPDKACERPAEEGLQVPPPDMVAEKQAVPPSPPAPEMQAVPPPPPAPEMQDNHQGPLIDPNDEGKQVEEGAKPPQRNAQRTHTQQVPDASNPRGNGKTLNVGVVEAPLGLQSWKSYGFTPSDADFALGHPIPPCLPTHQKHLRRIKRNLDYFSAVPDAFQDLVRKRRDKFDAKAARLDAVVAAAAARHSHRQAQADQAASGGSVPVS